MKKIIALALLTLTMTTAQATLHERAEHLTQTLAERAEWKESLIEEDKNAQSAQKTKADVYTDMFVTRVDTSHPGVIYYPVAVTPSGDEVTLFDGSVWQIKSWDREQTRGWLATDEIVLLANQSFFSFYDYKLLNMQTGAEVEANMLLPPLLGNFYTRQIIGFNDAYNYIYLSDGSVWTISPYDFHLYKKWVMGDIVMIGANRGWDSNIRPNILVNASYRTYIRANCIQ